MLGKLKRAVHLAKTDPDYLLQQVKKRPQHKVMAAMSDYTTKSFALRKLWIPLTYKCNLSCTMCAQWGEKGRAKEYETEKLKGELGFEEITGVIDDAAPMGPKIMLVGGEPFLYKHWYELAQYINKKGLRTEITTNGLALEEQAEKVAEVFDSINVSLDGPEEINDRIRGVKGEFQRVLKGVRRLAEVKALKKQQKPNINICCTISDRNYKHLLSFVKAMDETEIPLDLVLIQHFEFVTGKQIKKNDSVWGKHFQANTEFWRANLRDLSVMNVDELVEEIKRVKTCKPQNLPFVLFEPDFSGQEILDYYSSNGSIPRRLSQKCSAPWLEAFVYPEGNVWTCPGLVMGNIRRNSFKEIWKSRSYCHLRSVLNAETTFPICRSCANHWHNWSE